MLRSPKGEILDAWPYIKKFEIPYNVSAPLCILCLKIVGIF